MFKDYGLLKWVECVVFLDDVVIGKLVLDCYFKVFCFMEFSVDEVVVVEDIGFGVVLVVVVGVVCVVIFIFLLFYYDFFVVCV